jgi:hypothetical protein
VVSSGGGVSGEPRTRGTLSQTFLRVLLGYTALPGAAGVDEDESELTLGFWYLFQEALWAVDEPEDTIPGAPGGLAPGERERMTVARQLYAEVVRVLRQKVVWPASNIVRAWPKGRKGFFKEERALMTSRCKGQVQSVRADRGAGGGRGAHGWIGIGETLVTP